MTVYYLDASAWVKRYCAEAGSSWVQALFAQDAALSSASLGLVEVAATLARKGKAGEMPASGLEAAVTELRYDWDRFAQVHLTDEALEHAFRVARANALRGADAVHLASALLVAANRSAQQDEVVMVTSDRELREAASAAGLRVIDPARA
ncbi:MAG TPA: type II toxin-antitoxin system VapC family toxin [Planctomycetota bacterium]|nr:type II toxin-antitoxin system VapC family toxin [Planctomycetota bacterium]